MSLEIFSFKIDKVAVVDDDPGVRESYKDIVEDLNLTAVMKDGPELPPLSDFLQQTFGGSDALICDYSLRKARYATFDGAQVIAGLYAKNYPAILCTSFKKDAADRIRHLRERIPVLLDQKELDLEAVIRGFALCIREFKGDTPSPRKTYRTMVRVEEIINESNNRHALVKIPAWDPHVGITLNLDYLPLEIQQAFLREERHHAFVNLGAESPEDLFVKNWETV